MTIPHEQLCLFLDEVLVMFYDLDHRKSLKATHSDTAHRRHFGSSIDEFSALWHTGVLASQARLDAPRTHLCRHSCRAPFSFVVVLLTNIFLINRFTSKPVKTANGRCCQWFSLIIFSNHRMNQNKTRRKPFYFWIMQRLRGIRIASGKCARPRGNSHFPGGKLHSPWENLHAPWGKSKYPRYCALPSVFSKS